MRLLLDSHTFYWALWNSPNLSEPAMQALTDAAEIHVSAVSFYELGLKVRRKLLPPFPQPLTLIIEQLGYIELPVAGEHAERAAQLPARHRDPWDRIIAAQAIIEDMTVATKDREIAAFGARTIW